MATWSGFHASAYRHRNSTCSEHCPGNWAFAMVSSIHQIGKPMGKQTIAEFVESEAVMEVLRSVGVDFAQGLLDRAPRAAGGPTGGLSTVSGPRRPSAKWRPEEDSNL
ncbi:MAG: EAL domain-containing protein [Gammaproteobacteria bacterium]